MYDDPITASHGPSESGQDNDSALFKYLSLLGSAANGYRQQLQEQDPPQDASIPDFLKQVRGSPTEEPQKYSQPDSASGDAMQRLDGLFRSKPPSPDENAKPAFPGLWEPLPDVHNDPYIPRSYSNPSLQSNTPRAPGSTQPPGTLSGSPPTASSALPVNPLIGGKQDGPLAANSPPSNPLPAALQQWIAANRSNSFDLGAPAPPQPLQQLSSSETSSIVPKTFSAGDVDSTSLSEDQPRTTTSALEPARETPAELNAGGHPPNSANDAAPAALIGYPAMGIAAAATARKQQSHHPDWKPLELPDLHIDLTKKEGNNPSEIKQLQHLLNLAKIDDNDDPEMRSYKFLTEDGQISDQMLQMIQTYQKIHHLPGESILSKDYIVNGKKKSSITLRQLAMNRLADPRWNRYDAAIKHDVDYYNSLFAAKYPGFKRLDPDLVKAMLWTEVQGPDTKDQQWFIRPMQIGNKAINPKTGKRDPAMDIIKYGGEGTDAWAPEELRQQLKKSEFGETNVRAGIAYFYLLALQTTKPVIDDPTLRHDILRPGETLTTFAQRNGTILPELYRLNKAQVVGKERSLKSGTDLRFTKIHLEPTWDWDAVMPKYNTQTRAKNNAATVRENYQKVKTISQVDSQH